MPTKVQVKQSIEKIIDKGQNTAKTVRSVLHDIVEYATPQESVGDLQTFSFQGKGKSVDGSNIINLSVRGIRGLFANITFFINFEGGIEFKQESPELVLIFSIENSEGMFKELSRIIPKTEKKANPTFLLSVTNSSENMDRELTGNFPTNFRLVNFKLDLDLSKMQLIFTFRRYAVNPMLFAKGDYASTSIAIHVPQPN